MKVLCISLNPCIDRYLEIDDFSYGGMNRVLTSYTNLGGKGMNVARVAASFGLPVTYAGFLFNEDGAQANDALQAAGISSLCITLPGKVRVNLKLMDRRTGTITEFNEPGPVVTEGALAEFKEALRGAAHSFRFAVLTGSMPRGCPANLYRQLIELLQGEGVVCLLDAEGEKLAQGTLAHPALMKPNLYELELLTRRKLPEPEDALLCAKELALKTKGIVALSMGKDGALITNGAQSYFAAPPPNLAVHSTVGAGDSMMGGLLYALTNELPLEEMLRIGIACASSCVSREGTGLADMQAAFGFLPSICTRPLA